MDNNIFYVYEWYNTETNEVFYVGKGNGNRYKETRKRNKQFLNYYQCNPTDVRIIKDHLTEEDAFSLEGQTIAKYKSINQCIANITSGGYGGCNFVWTDEMREYKSKYNPMYSGKNRQRMKENNPMHDATIAKKVGNSHKRPIYINDIRYDGLIDAAKAYGVTPECIGGWLRCGCNSKNEICYYEGSDIKEMSTPRLKGKAVLIDGKDYYKTIKEAAQAIGVSNSGLSQALRKGKEYCKGHKCEYANQQPSQ